ncbi:MAG: PLP-dependent aminotransferase family protein [Proteobacteria bacterium]|nr:PLP-dependent aminotransferase family protein [Pseudomonadota bacterium]
MSAYRGIGLEMVGIPMDEQGMRMDCLADTLEQLCAEGRKPRFIYTLTTYQNPTGTCMPASRKRELIALAKRYDVPLVEDNCYGDVHFEGPVAPALFAMDQDATAPAQHVYIGSLSKIFAPGVRLGYLCAAEPLFSQITGQRFDAGSNTFAAAVLAEFYRDGIASHVGHTTPALIRKRDLLLDALVANLSDQCLWSRPAGGLFLWLRLPADTDLEALRQLTAARGFYYAPGRDFHVAGKDVPYLRLAFGHVPDELISEGVGILAECITRCRTSNAARGFDTLFD